MEKYEKKFRVNSLSLFGLIGMVIVCFMAIVFCVTSCVHTWSLKDMNRNINLQSDSEIAVILKVKSCLVEARLYSQGLIGDNSARNVVVAKGNMERVYEELAVEMALFDSSRIKRDPKLMEMNDLIVKIKSIQFQLLNHAVDYNSIQMYYICNDQLEPLYSKVMRAIEGIVVTSIKEMKDHILEMQRRSMIMTLVSVFLLIALIAMVVFFLKIGVLKHRELYYRDMMFRLLVENTDDVFFVYDIDKEKLEYVSQNIERVLGVPMQCLYETSDYLFQYMDSSSVKEILQRVNSETASLAFEREIYIKNPQTEEKRWMRLKIYPILVDNKIYKFISTICDLAEMMNSQQVVGDALVNALEANKSKKALLTQMSHEIRNPMNAIIGMTKLAQMSIEKQEKVEDCLKHISDSSTYLMAILNDVLDFSKMENKKMTLNNVPFHLGQFMKDFIPIFLGQAEQKQMKFDFRYNNIKNEYLIGDTMRLKQILLNILSNAFKFTNAGGEIKLEVNQICSDDKQANIQFVVNDSGIGMTQEQMDIIFIPFEQADSSIAGKYGGSGLGLAIAKNLVSLMGGTIEVSSELNTGSSFTVTISYEIDYEKEQTKVNQLIERRSITDKLNETAEDKCMQDLLKCRILLAEDNEINREIAFELLTRKGAQVDCVEDGKKALERFAQSKLNEYDVILMDVQMPNMDGHEATKKIRSLVRNDAKTVHIIAMTANAFCEDIAASFRCGMDDHISKPIEIDQLYKVINQHMKVEKCEKA